MLRKKPMSSAASAYRHLSERLEAVEAALEQLNEHNQRLEQQIRRLSRQAEVPVAPRAVSLPQQRRSSASSWLPEIDEVPFEETEPPLRQRQAAPGPGLFFWVLTLLIAALAGIATFYVVRPLGGTSF